MEYTLSVFIALILLSIYATSYAKIERRRLLLSLGIATFFQLIFDNLMTMMGLWVFDQSHTLGISLPAIPLENLIFGICLAMATIFCWERIRK